MKTFRQPRHQTEIVSGAHPGAGAHIVYTRAMCGSNLAGLTLLYIMLPCMCTVLIARFDVNPNKRRLLLLLLLVFVFFVF